MKVLPVAEILELPIAERIRLVELIWDSIAAVPEAVPLSDELKAELERRHEEGEDGDYDGRREPGKPISRMASLHCTLRDDGVHATPIKIEARFGPRAGRRAATNMLFSPNDL